MNEWEFCMRLWWINVEQILNSAGAKRKKKTEWKHINVKYSVACAWVSSRYDHLNRHTTSICRICRAVMPLKEWQSEYSEWVIQLKNHYRILFSAVALLVHSIYSPVWYGTHISHSPLFRAHSLLSFYWVSDTRRNMNDKKRTNNK